MSPRQQKYFLAQYYIQDVLRVYSSHYNNLFHVSNKFQKKKNKNKKQNKTKKDLTIIKLVWSDVIQQFHFLSAITKHYSTHPAMAIVVDRKLQEHSALVKKNHFFRPNSNPVPDHPIGYIPVMSEFN